MLVCPLVRFDGESVLSLSGDRDHTDSSARAQDTLTISQHLWDFRCIEEFKCEAHEHCVHAAVGIRKLRGVAARQLDPVDQMFSIQHCRTTPEFVQKPSY